MSIEIYIRKKETSQNLVRGAQQVLRNTGECENVITHQVWILM